jgi:hypothetical protein
MSPAGTSSAGTNSAGTSAAGIDGAGAHDGDTKLSALVTNATKDLSTLVRDEIALAKAEAKYDVKQAATGGGLFGVAGLCALLALLLLSYAAAYGINATGLSLAWSWLIVGGAYMLIALMCVGIGVMRLKKLRIAEATKRTTGESIATLKRAAR